MIFHLEAADVRRRLLNSSSGLAKENAAKNVLLCLEAPKHLQVTGASLLPPLLCEGMGVCMRG